MRLELRGHHVDITPALRRLVGSKITKLEHLLNSSAVSAQAILTREKHWHRTTITLHARGERFLHGAAESDKWETSVAEAVDQIVQQAQKVKNKWQDRTRRGLKPGAVAAAENRVREPVVAKPARTARCVRERVRMPRILRPSRQTITTMSVADAARRVDANGEGVVVFRDVETEAISVLYRRPNGELTLVETEA